VHRSQRPWLHSCGVPESETLLVAPADHVIGRVELFHSLARGAEDIARQDYLVTFGIVPTFPATGYGYIEAGERLSGDMFHVKQFKEKPDRVTAEGFLARGGFYWNSGMFLWTLDTIRSAYARHMPQVNALLDEISKRWRQQGLQADIADLYDAMPKVPVDIGIMEKAERRAVVPADIDWSDVGSWQALYEIMAKDEHDNAGPAERHTVDAGGCYVYSGKPVSLVGVRDLVIVETDDALLVCSRKDCERIKELGQKNK